MAKQQYLTKLVCTSEVSIGSFACSCLQRISTQVKAYVHAAKVQQLNVVKLLTQKFTATCSKVKVTFLLPPKKVLRSILAFDSVTLNQGILLRDAQQQQQHTYSTFLASLAKTPSSKNQNALIAKTTSTIATKVATPKSNKSQFKTNKAL